MFDHNRQSIPFTSRNHSHMTPKVKSEAHPHNFRKNRQSTLIKTPNCDVLSPLRYAKNDLIDVSESAEMESIGTPLGNEHIDRLLEKVGMQSALIKLNTGDSELIS